MSSNPLLDLKACGQSVWLDNLSRPLLTGGGLERLVAEDGISGVTSNPAIFRKAMTAGEAYDDEMEKLARAGRSTSEIYEALAIADIRGACDLLRKTHDDSQGRDGFVSLEVSPHLARDTDGTLAEAERLWGAVDRPNLLIKIPGTPEGVPAVEACLDRGININITLLFSLSAYEDVIEAHMRALESRRRRGEDLGRIASVASFFLSRIDVLLDERLAELGGEEADALMGKVGVANAKLAYRLWQEKTATPRWKELAAAGARVQKPLWASTSTKNPEYSDVMYVEPLIGPDTINTMPDETIDAFRDHGQAKVTVTEGVAEARETLARLERVGIDLDQATDQLVEEGIRKFVDPFDELMSALDGKRRKLAAAG